MSMKNILDGSYIPEGGDAPEPISQDISTNYGIFRFSKIGNICEMVVPMFEYEFGAITPGDIVITLDETATPFLPYASIRQDILLLDNEAMSRGTIYWSGLGYDIVFTLNEKGFSPNTTGGVATPQQVIYQTA